MSDIADMFVELGERLRSYRIDSGMEIEELAARTRIAQSNILSMEQGRMDLLPGQAFVKGFIRSICTELGKDPEPLLEIYNRKLEELSSEEENGAVESKKPFPLLLSLGILVVLVIGGVLLHGGNGKEPDGVVTEEKEVTVTEDTNSVIASGEISSFPSIVEEEPLELDLLIRAIEKTWLRVQADSSQPWETTLKAGDEIRLKAVEQIRLFIGNAGGILFELNGKRFGPPGSQGQVISDYVITRDNL